MVALVMFVLALFLGSVRQHNLRTDEREHLEAALQFVRGRELLTGFVPESAEFEAWTKEMDAKGFRFEGNGFTLDKRCGSKASQFCIYFSTGDGFATYRSWQLSKEKVDFDDWPLSLFLGFVVAGILSTVVSRFLLAPKTSQSGPSQANEG